MALSVNDIFHLLSTRGQAQYGGESVSQLEHALQCAQLAEENNEAPETIVAALLHDLGHLLVEHSYDNSAETQRRDDLHQFIALPFLSSTFPDAVLEPIRLHVDAKRYLCATDASYWQRLSPASKSSLELQGGVYSASEAAAFIAQPFAQQAVRLRRYDDLAKVPHRVTLELFHYRHHLDAVAPSKITA
jgi:phosphonate degradation associated HDIG domain protein